MNPSQRGKRIRTLSQLVMASYRRQSVLLPMRCHTIPLWTVRPAAWVVNWPGIVLDRMLAAGIYLYRPTKTKRTKRW